MPGDDLSDWGNPAPGPIPNQSWERRLEAVERKVDKLLDPEIGVYPRMTQIQGSLLRWAVGLMAVLLANLVMLVFIISSGSH